MERVQLTGERLALICHGCGWWCVVGLSGVFWGCLCVCFRLCWGFMGLWGLFRWWLWGFGV